MPLYNFIDSMIFAPSLMQRFRAFVLTFGEKP